MNLGAPPLNGQEKDPSDTRDFYELFEYIAIPETLVERLKAGDGDLLVVDLRAARLFEQGHIRGAENRPWASGVFHSESGTLPRDRDIFLVSEDGGYSFDAARLLLMKGYTRVYLVEGGMQNWPYDELLSTGGP
jgi:rhodanese-related sulfurtransferase